jgi:predicted small lipoprotein YifL
MRNRLALALVALGLFSIAGCAGKTGPLAPTYVASQTANAAMAGALTELGNRCPDALVKSDPQAAASCERLTSDTVIAAKAVQAALHASEDAIVASGAGSSAAVSTDIGVKSALCRLAAVFPGATLTKNMPSCP